MVPCAHLLNEGWGKKQNVETTVLTESVFARYFSEVSHLALSTTLSVRHYYGPHFIKVHRDWLYHQRSDESGARIESQTFRGYSGFYHERQGIHVQLALDTFAYSLPFHLHNVNLSPHGCKFKSTCWKNKCCHRKMTAYYAWANSGRRDGNSNKKQKPELIPEATGIM